MDRWLGAAIDYISRWLEFQLREHDRPGAVVAFVHRGKLVYEMAFGHADLNRDERLTPRHRFRVASHSKTFTAAGIMKLREARRVRLEDEAGRFVSGLHRRVASVTIAQLLSHGAGLCRDGADASHWADRRPFAKRRDVVRALEQAPVLERGTRFKYSNYGYGLLGLIIEAVTGQSYTSWIRGEVVDSAALTETLPDMPLPAGVLFARGHSGNWPLGRRVLIPGENPTHALAPATGFVSTAADLARFFSQLAPSARESFISVASRRKMIRRHWRHAYSSRGHYYGLGIDSGRISDWEWFGHAGAFQGYVSRTATIANHSLTISLLTNSSDGLANEWVDASVRILQAFAKNGAPTRNVTDWTGRWWDPWRAVDLLPMGQRVLVSVPALQNPLMDASEVEVTSRDSGRVVLASGLASHGEPVRRVRNKAGRVAEIWLGGTKLVPEAKAARELERRYEGRKRSLR